MSAVYEPDRPLVLESGLFDEPYYASQVADLGGLTALDHYLTTGWRAGHDPSERFSTELYLEENDDVDEADVNPLVHYLRYGREEGRLAFTVRILAARIAALVPEPTAPTDAEWATLRDAFRPAGAPEVDVVVPVYRGFAETLRCLYSVLRHPQATPFRLVVVDDCTPDEALERALGELAGLGLIDLIRTPENQGFVASCNLALAREPGRDKLLLNSDTEVFNDWLDRLRAAARGDVATVTPLSNNAEICSYPGFLRDNRSSLGLDDAALDRLAASCNRGRVIDVPTGIGFCLYIRGAALAAVGLLDVDSFGLGYGEENDLCRRFADAGWRNVLAADVFVRHYGGRSFGRSKRRRVASAVATVERLHPGYRSLVERFIAADPPRAAREALDRARLASGLAGRPAVLFVTHERGGGTERHIGELARELERRGLAVILCQPGEREPDLLRIASLGIPDLVNLPVFDMRSGLADFAAFLQAMKVRHLHVHHLYGFAPRAGDFFRHVAAALDCAYDVTLHDYFAICPRITLIDGSGLYCGEPELAQCEACIARDGADIYGRPAVWEWRERSGRLLAGARRVFVPDQDVARRFGRYFPERPFRLRPHFAVEAPSVVRIRHAEEPEGRTVAVIGAIGPPKGSGLLLACAEAAARRHPDLRFRVIGYTDRDPELRRHGNVTLSGKYHDDELGRVLSTSGASLAWFPGVWPETFSYTLSAALAAQIMPVAFDFGAIATRIRSENWGVLLPPMLILDPDAVVDALASIRLVPPPARIQTGRHYADIVEDYYELPALVAGAAPQQQGTA